MPTAPRIQQQVEPARLPAARRSAHLTPIAAGAANAQAIGNLGEAAQDTGLRAFAGLYRVAAVKQQEQERARHQANEAFAVKLANRADVWAREHVYKPVTGYLAREGEHALRLPEQAQLELREFTAPIEGEIQNPEQQLAWEKIKARLSDSTMLTVYRHVDGEFKKVYGTELASRVDNTQSMAIATALDPEIQQAHIGAGETAVAALAAHYGWGDNTTEKAFAAFHQNVAVGTVNALVGANRVDEADAYFTAHKDWFGDKTEATTSFLQNATVDVDAQKEFDRIDGLKISQDEKREEAKKIDTGKPVRDAKVRKEVLSLLSQELSADQASESAAIRATDKSIADIYDKNPVYTAVPLNIRSGWTSDQRTYWRQYSKNIADSRAGGGDGSGFAKHNDPELWLQLTTWAGSTDPKERQKFLDYNFNSPFAKTHLTQGTWQDFARGQVAMHASDEKKTTEVIKGPLTFLQSWNTHVRSSGIKPNTKMASDAMLSALSDAALLEANTGKKATPLEMDRIIQRNLKTYTVDVWGPFNPEYRGFQFTNDMIPDEERTAIIEAMKRRNEPPVKDPRTDPRLPALYRQKLWLEAGGK